MTQSPLEPTSSGSTEDLDPLRLNGRWVVAVVTGIVGLVVGVTGNVAWSDHGMVAATDSLAAVSRSLEAEPLPAPTVKVNPAGEQVADPATRLAGASTFDGNGVFLVGTDIEPGVYSGNPDASAACYWERLAGLSGRSGEFGDVISNDRAEERTYVTIESDDVAFSTTGCGEWTIVP
jgi:hypothetical protein